MKTLITAFSLILFSHISPAQENEATYNGLWAQVHKLEEDNFTKSALEVVEQIAVKASKEKNRAQRIKSLLFSCKYALILEEDAKLNVVQNLKMEIDNADFPTKNILEGYLANLYWQYFKQNRYLFYNRTATNTKVDSIDFRTWDLTTLFKEITIHFEKSLQNPLDLQKEGLEDFKEILYEQEGSKALRPTLFDLLAHSALDFYKTDENNITRPADKFEIDHPSYLCDAYSFSQLTIPTSDKTSLQARALQIYQQLVQFHFPNAATNALVDVDIERLKFIHSKAVFKDKDTYFLEVLNQSAINLETHESFALYKYEIAEILRSQGNTYSEEENAFRWRLKEAIAICDEVISKFPNSRGGKKCEVLKTQILAGSLQLTAEKYVPNNQPSRLLVKYTNHDQLELKAYTVSQSQKAELLEVYPIQKQLEFIKNLPLKTSWEVKLINENDYQNHSIEIPVPKMDNGQYIILATSKSSDSQEDPQGSYAFSPIQVTNLALSETKTPDRHLFQVIDRNTGEPKNKAKITFYYRRNYRGSLLKKKLLTDDNGFAAFPLNGNTISVSHTEINHKDEIAIFGGTYINRKRIDNKIPQITYQTFLFKDRSIYRPGQPLYFKGIIIENEDSSSKIAPNELVTVELVDVNGQTVSELDVETNEFGSFSGNFILPINGLNGEYHLQVYGLSGLINDPFYFSVEEYKRPKFETSFKPVTETFKVNDSITVKGNAMSFAGSSISDAKISYRIQRNVNFTPWYYWRRPYVYSEPLEIGHGETITNDAGDYEITFKAIPDLNMAKEDLPIFNYTITASITDINGETRSTETTVKVGYHAMTASIIVNDQLDKSKKEHEIKISTQNLNGQEVPAMGNLKMYKLKAPRYVLRNRPWPAPDYQYWEKSDFKSRYPHDAYLNENDPNTWEKGKLVFETEFNTEKSTQINLRSIKKWESGKYIIELATKDEFGQEVLAKSHTNIYSEKEKQLADNALFYVKTNKSRYDVGDTAEVTFYSNAENMFLTVWVEKGNEIVQKKILKLQGGCESLNIPVHAEDVGGFAVNYSYSAFNAYQSGNVNISVPYPNTSLEIETLTFRDKLQPGTDETWSFKIKGPKGEKVTAELLASMYDASLDQFRGHHWSFNPISRPLFYGFSRSNANQSFGNTNFRNYNAYKNVPYVPTITYDSFEWFGLDFNNPIYAQRNYLNRYRTKQKNKSFVDSSIKEGYVHGTVYNENGEPLAGVNVIIQGTAEGTVTDFDGDFTIKAQEKNQLVFSYLGYVNQIITIGKDNFFIVYLQEDSASLDEVVVTGYGTTKRKAVTAAVSMEASEDAEMELDNVLQGKVAGVAITSKPQIETPQNLPMDFSGVQIRKNLQETAFFFPHLLTDKEGNATFSFTTPEALTRWNLQLLAYTKDLKSATKSLSTVTQKDLMVLPNPPRFLREDDKIFISTKISNLTEKQLNGFGQLELTDVVTGISIDSLITASNKTQSFKVTAKGNTELTWHLKIPKGLQGVQYKIVAKAGDFSDGEQHVLPVLTNRMLVTETLPMWVRSNESKTFTMNKLMDHASTTLSHHKLTLEISSNPAWYAVQALPYLMEYPYECNEQIFARFYANTLAAHIANANPRIKEVFDQWANSGALLSNLEKNQELKSILIQETPWLRDAQSETEQKKRIALLFDLNKMQNELENTIQKLESNQMGSGAWPWFKGGRENRFITQHIVSGLGHLKQLSVATNGRTDTMVKKAIRYLDDEFVAEYERMKKYSPDLTKDHLSNTQIQYLYMRSFYKDIKTSKKTDETINYYKVQAQKYWPKRNLYSKGMIALILQRIGDENSAKKIMRSLKENSIVSHEMGMYWKENTNSLYWHQAPIETQALLIEAFTEIDGDVATIDNLKVWLLKNKQTNQWKTTKATSEAVYALLLSGSDWLSVTDAVEVTIGGEEIAPSTMENVKVEAGTGYFKTSWSASEVTPKMANIQLNKKGDGSAWGALHWQYFEDLDKITTAETPLQLKKKLFLKNNTDTGEGITEIIPGKSLKVGDLVRVRIELKADRDMEFIHMKDMRASGLEPIHIISQYKWQDGLGYYESTKDASTNFFIDYLPKGVYVFEYDLRVNNAGNFSNGITAIQSMYAPEFSSHSEGVRVNVSVNN
ncbi:carboxypeptidase-like regulatory domain-containing protein [Maribacter sp. CXY002]|uniref:alpha-2-macroglobulin family protein n=1 Tax=Maribacter luteocoastalis TaxID=3407671 RepID=UPI003B676DD1